MASFCPGQVVDDIVDRNRDDGRPRRVVGIGVVIVDVAKHHVVSLAGAAVAKSLSYVAIANIIDDMRCDRPGLAGSDSFAVVFEERGRRIARKILDAGLIVLLQISTNE